MTEGSEVPGPGLIDSARNKVNSVMAEAKMPSVDYKSTAGVYGGRLKEDERGGMVWDNTGFISRFVDRPGDIALRKYDEHTVKEPFKLLRHHPRWAYQFLFPGPKRYRGNAREVWANIQRLGLADYYGPHPQGIEVKKPELFKKGIILGDIYRSDQIDSPILSGMDRFQALAEAARYVKGIHDTFGPIGEVLVSDIIFQRIENGVVSDPVLNLPDIIYNPDKYNPQKRVGKSEQKATDMLDFLFSVGVEELRRSQNFEEVTKALNTVVSAYADEQVIRATASLAKRGRLTLRGILSQHNKARLGVAEKDEDRLRQAVIESCISFKPKS